MTITSGGHTSVKQLKVKDINTIFEKEELIIITHKTRKERKLFFSKEAIKQIKKHFVFNDLSTREYQEWKIGQYNIYMA